MERIEQADRPIAEIRLSEYAALGEELSEWLAVREPVPAVLNNRLSEFTIEPDIDVQSFLTTVRNALFSLYGKHRDKARSFADSRFTHIDEMVRRGMVSCGALTKIIGTVLREHGVPVKYIHGEALKKDGSAESRHSWLAIFDPVTGAWKEVDPTQQDFGMYPEAVAIRAYHDWDELRPDYDAGRF